MTLRFGFTPCPNDAFAFHALAHGLVPAPFSVEPVLLDIEELNRRSATGDLELTKLSFESWSSAPAARRFSSSMSSSTGSTSNGAGTSPCASAWNANASFGQGVKPNVSFTIGRRTRPRAA